MIEERGREGGVGEEVLIEGEGRKEWHTFDSGESKLTHPALPCSVQKRQC